MKFVEHVKELLGLQKKEKTIINEESSFEERTVSQGADLHKGNINVEEQLKYFFIMGKRERLKVIEWYLAQKSPTTRQLTFLNFVKLGIENIKYDYLVPTIEPSIKDNYIYYKEGEPVAVGLSCIECEEKARDFAPIYESGLATLEELYMWYAYRIAMGYWNISYVCNNFLIRPKETVPQNGLLVSGARKSAGARDGVENTFKIVKCGAKFCLVGKCFKKRSAANSISTVFNITDEYEDKQQDSGVPIVVLRKREQGNR